MERDLDQFTTKRLLRGESVPQQPELVEALGVLRSGTVWGRQLAEPTLIAEMINEFRQQAEIEPKGVAECIKRRLA